jgi:hypothetical protein
MAPKSVKSIVAAYAKGSDFESARDELTSLDPSLMADVLALAIAPKAKHRDLLVMALADVGYPPAMPHMRRWLDDPDVDDIAMVAASALDRFAGKQFKSDRLWGDHREEWPEIRAAIAAWWDAGVEIPEESTWAADLREKRARDEAEIPPPCPRMSKAERDSIYSDLVALKNELGALPPAEQHRLDIAAIKRVLDIYRAYAPKDSILERAIATLESGEYMTGEVVDEVRAATSRANAAAKWSKAHDRYRVPAARAAGHVAQGVLYALSRATNCRLQSMHNARDAMEYAGRGYAAIRAELDQQLAAVRAAR